jgi:NADH-quinone oxidoreductase subunit L
MTIPMMFLATLSVIGGIIGIPRLLGGNDMIHGYLSPVLAASETVFKKGSAEVNLPVEIGLMVLPLALILLTIYYAYFLFAKKQYVFKAESRPSFVEKLITRKFYVDELYEMLIQQPISRLSLYFHDVIEEKIIDRLVNNTGNLIVWAGKNIRYIQTGNVGVYLFFMVLSIIAILVFNLFN